MPTKRTAAGATDPPPRRRAPAATPVAKEHQLINLAEDLAEQQLRDGSASAQVITHYLKLGSSREQKEQRKLELEAELLEKKAENMASAKRVEELYEAALDAMRAYSGQNLGTFDD